MEIAHIACASSSKGTAKDKTDVEKKIQQDFTGKGAQQGANVETTVHTGKNLRGQEEPSAAFLILGRGKMVSGNRPSKSYSCQHKKKEGGFCLAGFLIHIDF